MKWLLHNSLPHHPRHFLGQVLHPEHPVHALEFPGQKHHLWLFPPCSAHLLVQSAPWHVCMIISFSYTRAMVHSALEGELNTVETTRDDVPWHVCMIISFSFRYRKNRRSIRYLLKTH